MTDRDPVLAELAAMWEAVDPVPPALVDKVLVASAEQVVYDAARRLLPDHIAIDDITAGALWRREYLYSRAATIYGGTAEVQRNIIARRLLDLGDD